jgi:general secretion pathway protein A
VIDEESFCHRGIIPNQAFAQNMPKKGELRHLSTSMPLSEPTLYLNGGRTAMYLPQWGLRDTPFRSAYDARYFFESSTHEEACARLHFLVEQHRRLGLLMGDFGSGKSMLLEAFARAVRRGGHPAALIDLVGLQGTDMLAELAIQFGLSPDQGATAASLWRSLADRIVEYRYQLLDTVILLDDADQASHEVLAQITRLAQLERSAEARLTLVLAGRRERMNRVGRALLELAELRIDIEPWEPADTASYLKHALEQAGCQTEVFTASAIERLHQIAQGIPRRVSQLADLSLLAGAGQNLPQIDVAVVESVYHELGVIQV